MDLPPALPAWFGSPGSLLAPDVFAERDANAPCSTAAFTKSSFAGGAEGTTAKKLLAVPNCVVMLKVPLVAPEGTVAEITEFETIENVALIP
jgi:hypothetical protein